VLGRLDGRTTDFIVAADGTVMHGLALIYVLRDIEAIDEFKIVQESLYSTHVLLTASAPLDPQIRAGIVASFRQRLGDKVDVRVEQVQEIPRERSGKYRYVVSRVALPASGTVFADRPH
jgi:phenylacetate-CoA ligase